ncbi:pilus assembly PilX family protein [Microbulbifer marinus]|uniref:Type IV pilus assembly protein PilX n=1 Tax=Microbulbifer marinus TaxID=658218 RepID=A0A1H4BIE1_9GAMM|nr:PilX N-terminal domain-containing pilus assembly protein [Microbulbifer marinus]SEA47955.1 type IV pilus assembly protein PilX [Microbulbifer marinus]
MVSVTRQKGAVLVVSMIILLVLSLISVSAARTVLLEEKMTFASRDAKTALEAAEAILRIGESYLENRIQTTGEFGTVAGLHLEGEGPLDLFSVNSWDGKSVEVNETINGQAVKGRYFIEMAGLADNMDASESITVEGYGNSTGAGQINVFRVVAQGEGLSPHTKRTIVVQYGRRF